MAGIASRTLLCYTCRRVSPEGPLGSTSAMSPYGPRQNIPSNTGAVARGGLGLIHRVPRVIAPFFWPFRRSDCGMATSPSYKQRTFPLCIKLDQDANQLLRAMALPRGIGFFVSELIRK